MSDIAIQVENLGKLYRLGLKEPMHDSLASAALACLVAPFKNFKHLRSLNTYNSITEGDDYIWANRDINFEVRHGEVLGIIGRNGAGKSTLLKLLSRITEPTEGRITINGRVASLLEVGTGFHPELTGRENIYMNGTILGMRKKEIQSKFDQIVDFSGVEKFIDTPIKRYSSGMTVRLAFSVAAHLEPEILVIDEVLAVGDSSFQKKCLGKMHEVADSGRTVLFVSHQLDAVSSLCSRAILLESGRTVRDGETEEVIDAYLTAQAEVSTNNLRDRSDRYGAGNLIFTDTWIEDDRGNRLKYARTGMPLKIVAEYEVVGDDRIGELGVTFWVQSARNIDVFELSNINTGDNFSDAVPNRGRVECFIPRLPLNVGTYTYHVFAQTYGRIQDLVRSAGQFEVELGDYYGTGKLPEPHWVFLNDHMWSLSKAHDAVKQTAV